MDEKYQKIILKSLKESDIASYQSVPGGVYNIPENLKNDLPKLVNVANLIYPFIEPTFFIQHNKSKTLFIKQLYKELKNTIQKSEQSTSSEYFKLLSDKEMLKNLIDCDK